MGADLLLNLLEIDHDRIPNWAKAKKHITKLTAKQARQIIAEATDCLPGELDEDAAKGAKARIKEAFEAVKAGWDGQLRCMVRVRGIRTTMLIGAGISWGDSIQEVEDLRVFATSGADQAAGFLEYK
jgi:hypothetical protein